MSYASFKSILFASFGLAITPLAPTAGVAAEATYVGIEGAPSSLMDYIGIHAGIFSKHGIDMKFVGAGSSPQVAAALVGGSGQFASLALVTSAPLNKQGQCLQYLTRGSGAFYNIIARPDIELPNANKPFPQNLVDLKGKRIGIISRGSSQETMMNHYFKEAGIDPADVSYIATGGAATAVAAFRNGLIDAAMTFPMQEQILKSDEFKYVAPLMKIADATNPFNGMPMLFSATTCDYAKSNPEVIASYCSAMSDVYKYVADPANKADVIDIVSKTQNLDKETARLFWEQYHVVWPSAKIDEATWKGQEMLLNGASELPSFAEHVSAACQSKL